MHDFEQYLRAYPQLCFRCNWELPAETFFLLGKAAAVVDVLNSLPLAPEIRQRLKEVALIKGAMSTTAIEGNTLSEEEAKDVHAGKDLPKSKEYLGTEIRNILDAFTNIFNAVAGNSTPPELTPELICAFNREVGKNLGDAFPSVPGKFRDYNVVVGQYRPPEYKYAGKLVAALCDWLQKEFQYSRKKVPDFTATVIEAVVSHVYIAWIHPFGDGNGRTARLVEFYLLARGGVPDICAHILSNHYNNTRAEYYRQLDKAGKSGGNLSGFLAYSIQGLFDGLQAVLQKALNFQIVNAWQNYVLTIFAQSSMRNTVRERRQKVLLHLEIAKGYTLDDIYSVSYPLAARLTKNAKDLTKVLQRDVRELVAMELLRKREDGKYYPNTAPLLPMFAVRRIVLPANNPNA